MARGYKRIRCAASIAKMSRNSNISPYKNIIFQKPSKRNHNPSRYNILRDILTL
jgi:hypothetical protein